MAFALHQRASPTGTVKRAPWASSHGDVIGWTRSPETSATAKTVPRQNIADTAGTQSNPATAAGITSRQFHKDQHVIELQQRRQLSAPRSFERSAGSPSTRLHKDEHIQFTASEVREVKFRFVRFRFLPSCRALLHAAAPCARTRLCIASEALLSGGACFFLSA